MTGLLQENINKHIAQALANYNVVGNEVSWYTMESLLEKADTRSTLAGYKEKLKFLEDKKKVGQVAAVVVGVLILIIVIIKFAGSGEPEIIEGNAGLTAQDTSYIYSETPIIPESDTAASVSTGVVKLEEEDLGEKEMNISEEQIRDAILQDYNNKKENKTEPKKAKKENKKDKKNKSDQAEDDGGFDFYMNAVQEKEAPIKSNEPINEVIPAAPDSTNN